MSAFDEIVEAARLAAIKSPCAKSQRGAVLFRADELRWCEKHKLPLAEVVNDPIVSTGWNGQPEPFRCTGTDACRKACGMICMHAEQRALYDALLPERADGRLLRRPAPRFENYEMLHVKVEGGKVVAGGSPKCAQCSRLLVELKVRGIWLYEQLPVPTWKLYDSVQFHAVTMRNEQLGDPPPDYQQRLGDAPRTLKLRDRSKKP